MLKKKTEMGFCSPFNNLKKTASQQKEEEIFKKKKESVIQ